MALNDTIFPEYSPTKGNAAAKFTSNLTPPLCSERQAPMPVVAPASPCHSEESSNSVGTAAISITGRFSNIERKYQIDPRVIGTGISGSVRECTNRTTGERYAVKSVRKIDPTVKLGGLAREIYLLQKIKHQSIVQLVDVCEDAEYLHIITDLCKGGEVFDKIVEKAATSDNCVPCFSEYEAARLLLQILTAVLYMHKRGIVHRDLKPENILFEADVEDSPIKIIDFGLARKYAGRRGEPPMTTVVGTPYYIAPEVLRRKYAKSCDLWSVGVIAYVLMCGYPPFNGATSREVHESVRSGRYSFPSEEWSGASGGAKDFVRRLLQKDPRKRMTASQALKHPWLARHTNTDLVMGDEVRQDDSSVEVVFEGLSNRDSYIDIGMEKHQCLCCAVVDRR